MSDEQSAKIWSGSFISMWFVQFFLFIVSYTLMAILPIYAITELGESQSKAGLVVTIMFLSAIIFRPISSKIIQFYGERSVMICTVFVYMIVTVSYIFVNEFIPLLIVRFIHGISFGIITTVTGVIVANIVPDYRKGEGLGYFAMSMNLAVVIGPYFGIQLLQFISFRDVFIILSILMVVSVILSLLVKLNKTKKDAKKNWTFKKDDLIETSVVPISLVSGIIGFSYGSIFSFVSLYAESKNLMNVASYFFLVFALFMIIFRPFLGRSFDNRNPRIVMVSCLIIYSAGLFILGMMNTTFTFILSAAFIGLGFGILLPGFQALSLQKAGPKRDSQAMSTLFTFYDTGIAMGAFVWGIVSVYYGYESIYILSSFIVIIASLLLFNMLNSRWSN